MENPILDILCCPITRRPLKLLPADELRKLNLVIEKGQIRNQSNEIINSPLLEGLVTLDGEIVYPIRDGIPVLLADECINWSLHQDSAI